MKPYYETELGKLYHGDCLEIMPELEPVDLVLTDPPYGINYQEGIRKNKRPIIGDDKYPKNSISMCIKNALNGVYVCGRWNNFTDLPFPTSIIAWVKNGGMSMGDLKHEHGRMWEAIFFYKKQYHKFIKRPPDVLYSNRTRNHYHPTQKPINLFIQIIGFNVEDLILDPFLGSGTTAIACERLKRKWIGIEIEEKYCEIAAKRIEQERKQLKLF